ncbi:diguanylate cyclase [Altererythrobacter sp. ZODW24]|uniref:sensor domain-containing diguanylate cyclase n=1 Tax=Altererythrobacter sp. ZODW24 TaxID=2185142 RepID=UPI000DF7F914|nr:diguanylate cyclase [Altererythrobacter sp. ZODW24]
MGRGSFWRLIGFLLALLGMGVAAPVAASPVSILAAASAAHCKASGSTDLDLAGFVASNPRWDCPGDFEDLTPQRIVLRIELPNSGSGNVAQTMPELPRYAVGRRAVFDNLEVLTVDADGSTRTREVAFKNIQPAMLDRQFAVELPAVTKQTRYVYIAIEGTNHSVVFDFIRLEHDLPGTSQSDRTQLLLLALLCGMLLMPLALNLAFYRVLRESFVLWHFAMVVSMFAQVVFISRLYSPLLTIEAPTLRMLAIASFGAILGTGIMFAANFIEEDKLSPQLRRLLPWGAGWLAIITTIYTIGYSSMGRYGADLFYFGCAPLVVLFMAVAWDAIKRGSRAAWFQLVGWTPLILVGITRLVTYALPGVPSLDANTLFYVAVGLEVIATTLGVADRFMIIRIERDRARASARIMEELSERDHLTGLMNRRAIEPNWERLRKGGYDTLALLDLDHFKAVNDKHGHQFGDEVLKSVAQAISADSDALAMRLGGEEFLLLMRGSKAKERAERLRQAIPLRVAADVSGLDHMLTASMGVVEMPRNGLLGLGFSEIYDYADRLAYQAKEAGRNRAVCEKLADFTPTQNRRKGDRRTAA